MLYIYLYNIFHYFFFGFDAVEVLSFFLFSPAVAKAADNKYKYKKKYIITIMGLTTPPLTPLLLFSLLPPLIWQFVSTGVSCGVVVCS